MNRTAKRVYWSTVAVVLAVTFGLGCSPLTGLWMLRNDGKIAAQYKLEPKDGQKDVVVAVIVVPDAKLSTQAQFASLDRDLASAIGKTLIEETAKEKVKVVVVEQSKIRHLQSRFPEEFLTRDRSEVAKKLGADYLIQIDLSNFELRNREFGSELAQGRAAMMVSVYESDPAPGDAKAKYEYPFDWQAPQLARTANVPLANYYQQFVMELGKRIAQNHVKHTADREQSMFRGR